MAEIITRETLKKLKVNMSNFMMFRDFIPQRGESIEIIGTSKGQESRVEVFQALTQLEYGDSRWRYSKTINNDKK